MAVYSGGVSENWRSAMIVPLYKGKGENYKGISLLIVVSKIYVGISVERVCRVTGGLIDDKQGGFRTGRGCIYQIFTLKQIGEKARKKKTQSVCGFHRFRKSI